MTKITLTNDFHNTAVNLVVRDHDEAEAIEISASQYYRAVRALCGITDCHCGITRNSDYSLDRDDGRFGGDAGFQVLAPMDN